MFNESVSWLKFCTSLLYEMFLHDNSLHYFSVTKVEFNEIKIFQNYFWELRYYFPVKEVTNVKPLKMLILKKFALYLRQNLFFKKLLPLQLVT